MNQPLQAMRRALAASMLLCFAALSANAQQTPAAMPELKQVLGFEPGARPAAYPEMTAYLEKVAASSDRVQLRAYGETPTGRKLWVMAISSPANLARLDQVGATLASLADGRRDVAAMRAATRDLPAVVWAGYGIHGDEISGPDGALLLIERLVTSQDPQILALLDRLVIYVDPMVNPDGRQRALNHITTFGRAMPVTDRQDMARDQAWPEGRGDHYLFDLNRDAMFMVLPQSEQRVRAMFGVHPQVTIDAHEMRAYSNHLFAIPADPLNPYLPGGVHATWKRFAEDIARAYDADGLSYYTRSWNEVIYPGYYDILPAYMGATPLLFEQAANSGVDLKLPNGHIRSYADTVANQLRSSLAALESAAANRDALFLHWYESRRRDATSAPDGPKAWIVTAQDPFKLAKLEQLLSAHKIAYQRLAGATRVSGLHGTWGAESRAQTLPAGSILIRTSQPGSGLIRNMFDYQVPMDAAFLRAERQRVDLGQSTQIYDVTAWSLPLAYDLDAYWLSSAPGGDWQSAQPAPQAVAAPAAAHYGYIYEDSSLFATTRLLAAGVRVRIATQSLSSRGQSYPAGSFLIRKDDQPADVLPLLAAEAARSGLRFLPADTALSASAGPDLGDDGFTLLTAPRIAILAGPATLSTSMGAYWQLLDQQIGLPTTLLNIAKLSQFDLSQYDAIVLPEAESVADLVRTLEGGGGDALKRWTQAGGTLIAVGNSSAALAKAKLTQAQPRADVIDRFAPLMLGRSAAAVNREDFPSANGTPTGSRVSTAPTAPVMGAGARALLGKAGSNYATIGTPLSFDAWSRDAGNADALRSRIAPALQRYLPRGAYLEAQLKPQHWLGYGVRAQLPALFRQDDALIADGGEVIGRYSDTGSLAVAGLIWPEAVGYIANTAFLVRERMGRGQLILFANDPAFRGYSLGTQRLFLNAAILGPGMRNR